MRFQLKMGIRACLLMILTSCLYSCKQAVTLASIDELYEEEQHDEIITAYLRQKSDFINDPQLLNKVGMAYYESNQYRQAIDVFDQAIKVDNQISKIYSNKGLSEIEIGDYVSAAVSCERAIELDKQNIHGYLNYSYALIKMKKWERALEQLNKAAIIEGTDEEIGILYANLSTVYLNLGESEKAKSYVDKAIALNKGLHWAYTNRAFFKLKEQQIDAAMADLEKGLQLAPNNPTLLYYRGLLLAKGNAKVEGCELLRSALRLTNGAEVATIEIIQRQIEKYCE